MYSVLEMANGKMCLTFVLGNKKSPNYMLESSINNCEWDLQLCYFTALCPPMGKTREIFDLHFLAKPGLFQANYCDVTNVEVPNCVLICNMRNEFVAVTVLETQENKLVAQNKNFGPLKFLF